MINLANNYYSERFTYVGESVGVLPAWFRWFILSSELYSSIQFSNLDAFLENPFSVPQAFSYLAQIENSAQLS